MAMIWVFLNHTLWAGGNNVEAQDVIYPRNRKQVPRKVIDHWIDGAVIRLTWDAP